MERHDTHDGPIWGALIEYHSQLARLARRRGSPTPEDHAQDTMIRMLPHIDQFDTPRDALRYANVVVNSIVNSEHRRRRLIDFVGLDGTEAERAVSIDGEQTPDFILRHGDPRDIEALVDVVELLMEGYTQTEIAPMLGRSRDSVVRLIDKIADALVAEDPTVLNGRIGRRARRMSAA